LGTVWWFIRFTKTQAWQPDSLREAWSSQRVANARQNTIQEELSQYYSAYYSEKNSLYSTGVEALMPTGAKLHLGYSLHDLSNNLQEHYGGGV